MLNQKTVTLTWLDSYSENPADFPRNGIIAKPLPVIMKKILISIFCLLVVTSCKQNHNSAFEITESDYYGFFNDVLDDNTIIQSKVLEYPNLKDNSDYWREILTPLTKVGSDEKMSQILTKSDIDYIFDQYSTEKKLKLDFDKLKLNDVSDEVLKNVSDYLQSEDLTDQEKYQYLGIYNLKIPLFSKNKKYAFFENSFYCGLLCAFDGIEVFEFKNGKWEAIGTIGNFTMS